MTDTERDQIYDNITNPDLDFSVSNRDSIINNQEVSAVTPRNFFLTFFNLFRSFVAVGILTLPYGISTVGPLVALIASVLCAFLIISSTYFLLTVATKLKFKGI